MSVARVELRIKRTAAVVCACMSLVSAPQVGLLTLLSNSPWLRPLHLRTGNRSESCLVRRQCHPCDRYQTRGQAITPAFISLGDQTSDFAAPCLGICEYTSSTSWIWVVQVLR